MNESVIAIIAAIVGFLGKSTWDLYWSRKKELESSARKRRIDFLERQLKEFYWPLYIRLQKNNVIWQRLKTNHVSSDDALSAEIDYKLEREYLFPNSEEMLEIIEKNIHLALADEQFENILLLFIRHISVYKAIRSSGRKNIDPIRFGEPWPSELFPAIEKRTKILQKQFDDEIERSEHIG